jgi:hypothetical protein
MVGETEESLQKKETAYIVGRANYRENARCQTQHYLQMPVVLAKLSANMATLCANGSEACAGELRGGASLGPTCLVPKAPFKDMDSAIICGW